MKKGDNNVIKAITDFDINDFRSASKPKPRIKYPIGGYAPGSYSCGCVICEQQFTGDKRAVQCEPCATKHQKFLNQQGGINPAFLQELNKVLEDIWENRNSLNYSHLRGLKYYTDKKLIIR